MTTVSDPSLDIVKDAIDRIRGLVSDIRAAIAEIAAEFSRIAKERGGSAEAIDALHAEIPAVGLSFWRNIASVSEGRLHPIAIANGCTALSVLQKMTIKEQEKALTVGVPVSIRGCDHRLVPAHLLSQYEIRKAITEDGRIRSLAEQVKYERDEEDARRKAMEEFNKSLREVEAEIPDETETFVKWRVRTRGRAEILSVPLTVTENDLLAILKEMRNAKH